MSAVSTRIAALQERLQDLLASMSPRDRMLFLGLVAAAILAVVGGSIYTMSSRLSALEGRIETRQENLQQVRLLNAEYSASKEKYDEIVAELRKNSSTDLSTFLEKSAEKAQIKEKLDAVKEKTTSSTDVLEEKLYAVSLSQLEQEELANFLYEIETAGFPMQIKTLKIKNASRRGEKTLRVDMDIATYRLIGGDSEG